MKLVAKTRLSDSSEIYLAASASRTASTWSSSRYSIKPHRRSPKTTDWSQPFVVSETELQFEYSRYCANRQQALDSTRQMPKLVKVLEALRATPTDYFAAQILYWSKDQPTTRKAVPFRALLSQSAQQRYYRYVSEKLLPSFCHRIKTDSIPRLAQFLEQDPDELVEVLAYSIRDAFYSLIHPRLNELVRPIVIPASFVDAKILIHEGRAWAKIHGRAFKQKLVEARQEGLISYQTHPLVSLL